MKHFKSDGERELWIDAVTQQLTKETEEEDIEAICEISDKLVMEYRDRIPDLRNFCFPNRNIEMGHDDKHNTESFMKTVLDYQPTLTEKPTLQGKNAESINEHADAEYHRCIYAKVFDILTEQGGCNINDFVHRLVCQPEYQIMKEPEISCYLDNGREWYEQATSNVPKDDEWWETKFEEIWQRMIEADSNGLMAFQYELSKVNEYKKLNFGEQVIIEKKAKEWFKIYIKNH